MRALKIMGWVVVGLVAAVALGLALGFPVMWLWNWLMPAIFGLPVITFWKAVGLLMLSHLLFKSHVSGHGHRDKRHREHWDGFARRVKSAVERESSQPVPGKE
jgi:uncharacterized membrane protein